MIQGESDAAERAAANIETPFSNRKIHKGVLYFVILTVAGLALLFFVTNSPQTLEALFHLDARFFYIAAALTVLDMYLGALRYHIFIRKVKPGVTLWLSFRANLATIFMGVVTPSQTGGGPAQIYIFYRAGISLADAMFVAVVNLTITIGFFLMAGVIALIILRGHLSQGLVRYFIQYGFITFAGFFVLFCLVLGRPDLLSRAFHSVAKLFSRVHQRWGRQILRFSRRISAEVDNYRASCTRFFRDERLLLFLSFGLTLIMYMNKFTLAYFLMRGLGVEGSYWPVIAIQTLIVLILYFAPTPGGSGIAELSIAGLMSMMMADYLLPVFTLLYRFFLLYFPALLGFFVVLAELKLQTKKSVLQVEWE